MKKSIFPVLSGLLPVLIYAAIAIALIVGEVKCIIKFVQCDFEPSYKAEAIYGLAVITGAGCIVGYLDLGK